MRLTNAILHTLIAIVLFALTGFAAFVTIQSIISGTRHLDGNFFYAVTIAGVPVILVLYRASVWAWRGVRQHESFNSAWLRWGPAAAVVPAIGFAVISVSGDGYSDEGLLASPFLIGTAILLPWLAAFGGYLFLISRKAGNARPMAMFLKALRWSAIIALAVFSAYMAFLIIANIPKAQNATHFLLIAVASGLIWACHRLFRFMTQGKRPMLVAGLAMVVIIGVYAGAAYLSANFLNINDNQFQVTFCAGFLTLALYALVLLKAGEAARSVFSLVFGREAPASPVGNGISANARNASISRGSFLAAGLWGLAMIYAMIDSGAFSPGAGFDFVGFLAFLTLPVGTLFALDWILGRKRGAA